MNQVDYRHCFKGRVWKNEGGQKVQEQEIYRIIIAAADEEYKKIFAIIIYMFSSHVQHL